MGLSHNNDIIGIFGTISSLLSDPRGILKFLLILLRQRQDKMHPTENNRISVSIVIPTYQEAENLPLLIPQIAAAFEARGWTWEVIVVDDNSPDSTPAVLASLKRQWPQVRSLIRSEDRGLSSAVLAGFTLARYDILVVMDADLSHPPEMAPFLVDPLLENRADFVIGSRNVTGGRTESWGIFRWLNSAVATALSRPFIGGVKDSMAGFFALHRETLDRAEPLNPIGYKIGLELIVKCGISRIVEIPIVFRNRTHGKSKLTLTEQFRYLEHLSRLYDHKYPRGSPRIKFLIACLTGAVACLVTFAVDLKIQPTGFLWSLALGLVAMILVTLLFFFRYVRTQRQFIQIKHPYPEFFLISACEFSGGMLGGGLVRNVINPFSSCLCAIGAMVLIRYALRKVFLHDVRGLRSQHRAWAEKSAPINPAPSQQAKAS